MKKYLLLILSFIFISTIVFSQNEYLPCGTAPIKSEWLQKYQQNPDAFSKDMDTVIYVPLSIHIVGSDQGAGYFPVSKTLDALCTLNADYEMSNIQFFVEGEFHYINNSFWNTHDSTIQGAMMMFENNIENTLNCYILIDPAGNCGYNLPYAGIALSKSCMGANDHTWAHEVGHALSLPHPFLGWEGGISHDGSVSHSYNDPAPTEVYYDYTQFKDSLITDTIIIDTALVEWVNGSNCYEASDGFCDTPPDYLNYRWPCNDSFESTVEQTDPSGAKFVSDGTLFMSYSYAECKSRFSLEEISAMRANLYDKKPGYLYNQTPTAPIDGPMAITSPTENDEVQYDHVYLEWEALENVSHYYVQLSRLPTFTALEYSEIVENNSVILTELQNGKTYYLRIRPFSSHFFCTSFSESVKFKTGEVTATKDLGEIGSLSLFPNPVKAGQNIKLATDASFPKETVFQLFDITDTVRLTSKMKKSTSIIV